ncbi:MAG TPA: Gfo/Idh/MocA family oxidoreductase [Clostridiales bacterium]|nr:Gfo/Idh/MocA family oxidoreductase [Clostridiales bacterium]
MHKIGIIGYGGMAVWHHNNVAKTGCITAAAAYDIDPERVRVAEKNGLKGFYDLKEFLDSKLFDIVLVATPNNFHKDLSCAALKAGYHVVCEKPVTLNVAELEEILETARQCSRLFTVHHNRRWDSDFLTVKKELENDAVGTPYTIESCVHGSGGVVHGWRAYKVAGGGMLYDWGIHLIDQIMLMIDQKVVDVHCQLVSVKTQEVDDYFKLILRFESGLTAQLEVGTYCLKPKPRWYVNGTKGSLIINDWDCNGTVVHSSEIGMEWEPEVVQTKAGPTRTMAPRPKETLSEYKIEKAEGDWVNFYRNVAAAIDNKEELFVKPGQLLRVMKVIEAAFKSAETGHSVAVDI